MNSEIIYIIDRSGSMGSIWDDASEGLKQFIREQQQVEGDCKFTLIGFDDQYEVFIDGRDLNDVDPDTVVSFCPRGMTALYDAIGKAVTNAGQRLDSMDEAEKPEKVIVVIMTDGHENHSREYHKADIADMIKHQEDVYSWEFIFMGVGVDVMAEGAALNMKAQNVQNFTKDKTGLTDSLRYASASTARYRS